ncbi:TPA: peptidase M26 [Streptococcus pneumoniae]|nr:peptidase M26 [Streptococcus pneumoniae]MBW7560890.1 peptidase M26 [Streptococcus pneumoniae]HET0903693.1 peptidase M26 [Streptococcus pneumoniae]HET1459848.1 peptidase M26 [Streptococcus pneumoniae]HEU6594926.1 peptidase M26 [Streptococcus pneumoniae]
MRQTNVRGSLSLRGFRKLRTGAIVATGVILLGLGFSVPTASVSEQDGVWVARTVAEVKADIQKEGDLFKYVIKWGDTLSVISEASNIPVDVLQEMNQASGKNLFLPHNELYFTEVETVSDTVTKHKIVIKESGASGEVRTYEVLLKKDQETKAVTFELTDVTEKVEKMTVNYSPVYQPVSVPVVERAEESVEEPALVAPAVTSPEVKEETEDPVVLKAEEAATTPATKETAPEVVTPAEPNAETPAPKVEAPTESFEPKGTEPEVAKPAGDSVSSTSESNEDGNSGDSTHSTLTSDETKPEEVESTSVTDNVPSNAGTTNQPLTPTSNSDDSAPKEVANGTEGKVEAPKVEEAVSEGEEGNAETTNNPSTGATPSSDETTEQSGTPAPKPEEEAPVATETSAASAESTESAPVVAKPAEPKAETPEATITGDEGKESEESGTSATVESTPAGEEGKAEATEEAEETGITAEANPAPKESGEEGKAEDSVSSTESSSTASEGESTATQPAVEAGTDSTSEAEELATTETATTPKTEEPEAVAPAPEAPSESDSKEEDSAAGDTTVTEEQPAAETGSPATQPTGEEGKSEQETPAPSKPATPSSTEEVATEPKGTESEVAKPATPEEEGTTAGNEGKETEEAGESTEEVVTPIPVTDNSPSDTGTTDQPVASNSSSEAPAPSVLESKAEDSATGDTTVPETLTNTEESGKQSVETSHSGAESATEVTGEASKTTSGDEGKEEKEADEQSGNSTEPSTVSEGGSPATQPAGEEDKSEPTSETSTTPSVDVTNDSGNSESSPSVIEGNKEETNSQNTEASTENRNSESSNSDSEKPQGDEPAVQVGSEPTASTEGTSTGKENSAPKAEEKEVDKKLELRNISTVELFTVENNKYRHVTSFDTVPNNPNNYFMKVKSEKFKDVMLPVSSITSVTRDSQEVYKIVGQANNLIQHENNSTLENYTYYLPKTVKSEKGVYTSFKNLVDAINSNPDGTFRLGATMDAREVELQDGKESYIENEFTGKLIGENNGKYYAIYNLKKPLFNILNRATVKDLSIKNANISAKVHAATIAKEAKNNTTITSIHSSGVIAGEHSIGGLVSQVDNSTISNSSFTGRITNTYDTQSSYQIGGLVGKLSGAGASIDRSISSIDMATNANKGDQVVGGIAGAVDKKSTIKNSYVEGNLNNVKHFGYVGGVAGYLWDRDSSDISNSGNLTNVLSDVNMTNGNAIAGYDFTGIKATDTFSNKNNKVVNVVQENDEVVSKDSYAQRGTLLESNQVAEKKDALVHKNNIKTEDFNFSSRYVTDYRNVEGADVSRLKVYKNIEKLLPFYNRETIVKYGNLVDTNNDLFTKEIVSVVPMSDKDVITDINKDKQRINKLLLHYSDNTSQTFAIKYLQDFSKVAEYEIINTKLMYTPNTLLHDYNNIVNAVLEDLKSVQYNSDAVRKVLDISSNIKLTELYLDEQFTKTKENIKDSLSKLLSADAAIAENNNNSIIDNYVIEKIKNNKEALLLGLTYLERWYNFKYDNVSAKDLVLYHLDFFGKSNSSALDNVIELGKSGFNNLLAKNNVITYNVLLSKNYGTESLFKALEGYRKVFLPNITNNDWFKKQSKAYIVEEKSTIPEVSEKQSKAGTSYSIGVYDRLTSPSWKYQSMVLPLLTLPEEKMIFMIANISTIGFGAYDRYRSSEYPKGEKLNKFVEENAHEAAKRFRNHYDYWYKILDNDNKEKLFRSVLVYDAFRFGNDKNDKIQEANFESNHSAIKNFFGPVGNNVVHNKHGAYATGDAFYYMAYRMLDKAGAVTYTHEMTHNSDREIYLGGYGRRSGLGPEFYAKGLLQAPDHSYDPTITINSVLKYDDSENSTRLQIADPTQRFSNAEDLHSYMHNMFDLIYTLEILEGRAVAKLGYNEKNDLLRKIENIYKKDPDGNQVYATNAIRRLTPDEIHKLNSFDSLIENDVITRRGYKDEGEYERNGYHTINLFSPIYSALSSKEGTPGDLMGRRMAFELLAAKGYKEGMVPYISNQYEKEAKDRGHKINSYGKEIGLVTDDLVLEKVFNKKYTSWVRFKKDMYKERENRFSKLTNVTFINPDNWGRQSVVRGISDLEKLINEAVQADANNYTSILYPETNSRVLKLKKAIFKAYLDKTDDFRTSIFDEEK